MCDSTRHDALLYFLVGFICGVYFVIICSSSLLLLVPREDCASCLWHFLGIITKTCLSKYTENFTTKYENFQIKKPDILHTSAQNIDWG